LPRRGSGEPGGGAGGEAQRILWDALKKSINGLINKVNVVNIKNIVPTHGPRPPPPWGRNPRAAVESVGMRGGCNCWNPSSRECGI